MHLLDEAKTERKPFECLQSGFKRSNVVPDLAHILLQLWRIEFDSRFVVEQVSQTRLRSFDTRTEYRFLSAVH